MKWINYLLWGILAGMCVVRSGVQVRRMLTESPRPFLPTVAACSEKSTESEALIVWRYRNLGARCK